MVGFFRCRNVPTRGKPFANVRVDRVPPGVAVMELLGRSLGMKTDPGMRISMVFGKYKVVIEFFVEVWS